MSADSRDPRDPRQAYRTQSEAVTEAAHDSFWRRSFRGRPYIDAGQGYEHYRPAFRYGWQARNRLGGRAFEDVEAELEAGWDAAAAGLSWDEARPAVRDAYTHRADTDLSTPGNPLA